MNTKIIRKSETIISKWSGGESRQYYIYPESSDYGSRNFSLRVSLAVSNTDDISPYSSLDGFIRHLIMLEGTAHVIHEGHYDLFMNPYKEIDIFDGGWESYGAGKVKDFNMMLSNDLTGSMSVIEENKIIGTDKKFLILFCGCGNALFLLPDGKNIEIGKEDMIVFENISHEYRINTILKSSKLIRLDICDRK